MEEYLLLCTVYNMLFQLDARGKKNWVTRVRLKLYEFGFGFVLLNQGVGE